MHEIGGRLAIVGSVSLRGSVEVAAIVEGLIAKYQPDVVVSGGARGVDTIAREVAEELGVPVVEHLPAVPRWEDGYKPRNLKIANDCTRLVRIVASDATTYGSGWTRDRAKEMGKPTEEFVIDRESDTLVAADTEEA